MVLHTALTHLVLHGTIGAIHGAQIPLVQPEAAMAQHAVPILSVQCVATKHITSKGRWTRFGRYAMIQQWPIDEIYWKIW